LSYRGTSRTDHSGPKQLYPNTVAMSRGRG